MLVVRILSLYGYRDESVNGVQELYHPTTQMGSHSQLGRVMFLLLCGIPFLVSVLQIVVWSKYTLKNKPAEKQQIPLEVQM
jgi:hypothetical protein